MGHVQFMIDSSEIEAVAIKLVFPGKKKKLKMQRILNLYVANLICFYAFHKQVEIYTHYHMC